MLKDCSIKIYDLAGALLGTINHIEEAQLEAVADDDSEIQRLADSLSKPIHDKLTIENVAMAIPEELTKARSMRGYAIAMPAFSEKAQEIRVCQLLPGDVFHIGNMRVSDIYNTMWDIIATTHGSEFKQVRKHRKKRINKKWLGRFGLNIKMGYYKTDIQNPHIVSIN